MNARSLDKFHDTGYEYIYTVADRIDLDLFAHDVFIDKYGLIFIYFNSSFQIVAQIFLFADDLHGATAEYEGRTNEHGIADLSGCLFCSFDAFKHIGASDNVKTCICHKIFDSCFIAQPFHSLGCGTYEDDPVLCTEL